MCRKISPRVDIAFKKLFGVEDNKDLLMSLINSIVSEADQVTDVILLNPYNAQNFYNRAHVYFKALGLHTIELTKFIDAAEEDPFL